MKAAIYIPVKFHEDIRVPELWGVQEILGKCVDSTKFITC